MNCLTVIVTISIAVKILTVIVTVSNAVNSLAVIVTVSNAVDTDVTTENSCAQNEG